MKDYGTCHGLIKKEGQGELAGLPCVLEGGGTLLCVGASSVTQSQPPFTLSSPLKHSPAQYLSAPLRPVHVHFSLFPHHTKYPLHHDSSPLPHFYSPHVDEQDISILYFTPYRLGLKSTRLF